MGAFDYLTTEYPLPKPSFQNEIFQTKDTEAQFLANHKITAEGRLLQQLTEIVPEAERPRYREYLATGTLWYLAAGSIRNTDNWVDANYDGDLCFYGSNEADEWGEFVAHFQAGQLQSIEEVPSSEA